jgi:hypothetical protein
MFSGTPIEPVGSSVTICVRMPPYFGPAAAVVAGAGAVVAGAVVFAGAGAVVAGAGAVVAGAGAVVVGVAASSPQAPKNGTQNKTTIKVINRNLFITCLHLL